MVPEFSNPEATLALTFLLLMGATQWLKSKMGLEGRAVEIVAGVLGLLAGAGWYIASFDVPDNASAAFALILSAVMFGLVPSGLYKLGNAYVDRNRNGPPV